MSFSHKIAFKRIFELDLRSLGLARAALGFLVFLDCVFRLTNFTAHYTELGVMPLSVLERYYKPLGPCLQCLNPSDTWTAFLFFIHAMAGLTLMLGWKSRTSILLCWLMTISIHYRNPLVIDGGDVLLRCFLLWLFFLPCSEYYSWDSKKKNSRASTYTHWFTLALPLQLFALYFMSALLKTGADWWPNGTATGYALSLEAFTTPFGKWLTNFPEALKVLTRVVFLTELWAPFLLLMWGWWRLAAVVIFFGFHAGLGLAMDLALFPWIAFACLFTIVPTEFWKLLEKFVPKKVPPTTSQILKPSRMQHALAYIALPIFLVAAAWNVATLMKKALPKPARRIGQWTHVDQYWGMFAPFPLKDSGWYEFGMELWNGEYVYGFVNDTMEYYWDEEKRKPVQGNRYFVDQRWRKYLVNLWDRNNSKYRPALAAYLCRKWNQDFPAPSDQALKVDIEFKLFQNTEYLKPVREPASVNLGSYDCAQQERKE